MIGIKNPLATQPLYDGIHRFVSGTERSAFIGWDIDGDQILSQLKQCVIKPDKMTDFFYLPE
jgi:hypothetical protein